MTVKQLKAFLLSLLENVKKANSLKEVVDLLEKIINTL